MKLLNFLYGITGLIVFLILVWLFAVPNELMQERMENAVSRAGDGSMTLSIDGMSKGMFFSLYADTINLSIANKPALTINDLSINFTPRHLNTGKLAFLIKGVFITLGAIGLASMWEAVFADMGTALVAVANSTRILAQKSAIS